MRRKLSGVPQAAEIAHRDRRGAERRRLSARPGKMLVGDVGKGCEWSAARFLAHPAMADADL
jgi:hypothetical protein